MRNKGRSVVDPRTKTAPWALDEDERPLGITFSGGGARGAFHVGVWEVLSRHPRGLDGPPRAISGTSAGSINGALIAAGLRPAEMLQFWLDLASDPPVRANKDFFVSLERALPRFLMSGLGRRFRRQRRSARILGSILRKHRLGSPSGWLALALEYFLTARFDGVSDLLDAIHSTYLFDTDLFKDRIAQAIGGRELRRPRCRLAINTVDIRTGGVIRFVSHPPRKHSEAAASHYRHDGPITVDMIVASCSIPLLFAPVRVAGTELWDGGLLVNTPLAPTVALGAQRIIPVLVTSGASGNGDINTFGDAIERLADAFLENAYNTDRKLLLERNKLAKAAPERGLVEVELYEAIRPSSSRTFNAGSYLFFEPEPLLRMYEAGRQAALRWLDAGPPIDSRPRGPS